MFKNVVQLAYVTTDLERAVSVFRDDQGVREFATFDSLQLPTVGGGQAVINWGLTYVGDLQLEIIQPVSGEVDVYRALLPERSDQFVLRSHHIASQLDSTDEYDAVMAGYRQRGHRIALEASFGGTRFFYADTYDLLGHFQEYLLIDDATKEWLATLPRN